jgi:hypothetical protein
MRGVCGDVGIGNKDISLQKTGLKSSIERYILDAS